MKLFRRIRALWWLASVLTEIAPTLNTDIEKQGEPYAVIAGRKITLFVKPKNAPNWDERSSDV